MRDRTRPLGRETIHHPIPSSDYRRTPLCRAVHPTEPSRSRRRAPLRRAVRPAAPSRLRRRAIANIEPSASPRHT